MRTKLQGGTIVGFNGHTHVLIRDGVIVWEDDCSLFVGKTYAGLVDRILQAPEPRRQGRSGHREPAGAALRGGV